MASIIKDMTHNGYNLKNLTKVESLVSSNGEKKTSHKVIEKRKKSRQKINHVGTR